MNDEIRRLLLELNDALCSAERNEYQGSTLILVPTDSRIPIEISLDGKPADIDYLSTRDEAGFEGQASAAEHALSLGIEVRRQHAMSVGR